MEAIMAPGDVTTLKDVHAEKFIKAFAQHMKNQDKIDIPKWAEYVKTGHMKELGPLDRDWMYVRAAAIMRKIYIRQGTGVGGLRKAFGDRKRRGSCTQHFTKASGKIIRHLVQQLESLGWIEEMEDDKGGRKMTRDGQRECDTVAVQCAA